MSTTPAEWPYSHVDKVRFADLDAMRHVNNVAFLGFFEDARIQYITGLLGNDPTTRRGFGLIFAECRINYRAPAFFDEEIRTCIRPGEIAPLERETRVRDVRGRRRPPARRGLRRRRRLRLRGRQIDAAARLAQSRARRGRSRPDQTFGGWSGAPDRGRKRG